MSLEAWIIDELEREIHEEVGKGDRPELDIQRPEERDYSETEESEVYCERGVKILDISPTQENVIDL